MWSIENLKKRAWKRVTASYLPILVCTVLSSIQLGSVGMKMPSAEEIDTYSPEVLVMLLISYFALAIIPMLFSIAIVVFLQQPLMVGCNAFYLKCSEAPCDFRSIGVVGKAGFQTNYKNVVKVMGLRYLYIFLWSLLFIVPGIIKALEYRMVPFLLAEDPNMDHHTALKRSREMMYGHKAHAFLLNLSFFGWVLTGMFTCGLSVVLWVNPYMRLTDTQLYIKLKKLMESGSSTYQEEMREEAQDDIIFQEKKVDPKNYGVDGYYGPQAPTQQSSSQQGNWKKYNVGYWDGFDDGYLEGRSNGYNEGYDAHYGSDQRDGNYQGDSSGGNDTDFV